MELGTEREILAGTGVPHDQFAGVPGKADSDPIVPDNPFLAANRRLTITMTHEPPPLPPGLRP